jgi:NAD(P)-dependent dehydrogenase (short-subunit alcohol dehydrogenase family)
LAGRFDGKVLFATGAASGIGAATARRFAAEGGRVAVADLDGARADSLARECDGATAVACDVSDERSVEDAVREAHERLGRIDCVFNAAGVVKFTPLEELSLDEWNRHLAVHLTGTFLVCRATLPLLRSAGGGSIVNVASTAALLARPNLAAYAAAKGGIISFSRQLALDAAPSKVRVNVIAPGSVRTPMTADVYAPGENPRSIQSRFGEPEEIAAAACFLFADDSAFFTAATLVADGGATAL